MEPVSRKMKRDPGDQHFIAAEAVTTESTLTTSVGRVRSLTCKVDCFELVALCTN